MEYAPIVPDIPNTFMEFVSATTEILLSMDPVNDSPVLMSTMCTIPFPKAVSAKVRLSGCGDVVSTSSDVEPTNTGAEPNASATTATRE